MKCKYWKTQLGCYKTGLEDKCIMFDKTDNRCNIIKQKPRFKKIKAWAFEDDTGWTVFEKPYKGEYDGLISCFILIDRKYLEDKK